MLKKCILFALLLCFILPCLPAAAVLEADVCPVNSICELQYNENDTPVLYAQFSNTSDIKITFLEFHIYLYDPLHRPVYSPTTQSNYFQGCTVNWELDGYAVSDWLSWELKDYPLAVYASELVVDNVVFADETTWSMPNHSLYQEAYGIIYNERTEDGSYILSPDNALYVLDDSYSSHTRKWFIWSDEASDWVPFSNQLWDQCFVWKTHGSIKLIINDNPNLYWMEDFKVVRSPGMVNATVYNTGQTLSMLPVTPAKDISATLTLPETVRPCVLALWDLYETTAGRLWYIWDNTTAQWVLFSTERGPVCQIWQDGPARIALEYAGQNARIKYNIAFVPPTASDAA